MTLAVHYKAQDDVKTAAMDSETSRSEQVIEDYKKRKIAASALRRIHEIVQGFEQQRVEDRRLAWFGVVTIALILIVAAVVFFNLDSVRLS